MKPVGCISVLKIWLITTCIVEHRSLSDQMQCLGGYLGLNKDMNLLNNTHSSDTTLESQGNILYLLQKSAFVRITQKYCSQYKRTRPWPSESRLGCQETKVLSIVNYGRECKGLRLQQEIKYMQQSPNWEN